MSNIHIGDNSIIISNPHMRIIDDLKERNKYNGKIIAGEYFGSKFTYNQTFQMIEDYKRAFLSLEGSNPSTITISAPSIISSVNAMYGAIDANKIVNLFGPGFLNAYPNEYIKEFDSKTMFVLDSFLTEDFINNLAKAGVKNVIITSVADYMNPIVKTIAKQKGMIPKKDFLDEYVGSGKKLPQGMQFIRLKDFAKEGAKIKETINFPYEENQIAARFLTGATTSKVPKCVKIYADGFNYMAEMYSKSWFDFKPGDRNAVFIPMFYATGAVHGIHAGLFSGLTNIYKPKYDRFAFGQDLLDSKANIALVAPSHVATLDESGLKDGSLSHLKYIFIGGEAILPSQMEKFRKTAERLGIGYILNGYGMTETASMTGVSDKEYTSIDDVTITPSPGVKYRIVDSETGEVLPNNKRGILEEISPCVCAGYTDEKLNEDLFTKDNWVHTGDVAVRYDNGKYRVFGRVTDYFENNNQKYSMFDIEEAILKHPGILETEVFKFNLDGREIPAAVVVIKKEWNSKIEEIVKYISELNVPGIEYLIGTRFIDKFKTNPITSKRDYLSLPNDTDGYYSYNKNIDLIYRNDIIDNEIITFPCGDIEIFCDKEKTLTK